MFSIFKKHITPDLSMLAIDLHSHLIPGIDDGSKTVEESLIMLKQLATLGYKKVITTPHVMSDYYPNNRKSIMDGLANLNLAIKTAGLAIELEAAAEYFVDDYFMELLRTEEPLLTFSGKHILIEFSMMGESVDPLDIIFKLTARGYIPILAHPERYLYYQSRLNIFKEIYNQGCRMQVNLLSLCGHYGSKQKDLGWKLLKMGIVDYLGTDTHRTEHLQKISILSTTTQFRKLVKNNSFLNKDL